MCETANVRDSLDIKKRDSVNATSTYNLDVKETISYFEAAIMGGGDQSASPSVATSRAADAGVDVESAVTAARDVNPSRDAAVTSALRVLSRATTEAAADVARADRSVAEHEDRYIGMTWAHGNLMRGWESYCRRVDRAPHVNNGAGTGTGAPKQRKVRPADRMFSIVSATSAVRTESANATDLAVKGGQGIQKKKKKKR
jgi:Histone acetyltransferase subunit NuA4